MKPTPTNEQCEYLAHLLADGRWHKGRTLRMNGRLIRAACAEQPGRFLSSQKGYKLVRFATEAEIDESVADLRSRIKHLTARAEGLEQAKYNQTFGQMTEQEQLL